MFPLGIYAARPAHNDRAGVAEVMQTGFFQALSSSTNVVLSVFVHRAVFSPDVATRPGNGFPSTRNRVVRRNSPGRQCSAARGEALARALDDPCTQGTLSQGKQSAVNVRRRAY